MDAVGGRQQPQGLRAGGAGFQTLENARRKESYSLQTLSGSPLGLASETWATHSTFVRAMRECNEAVHPLHCGTQLQVTAGSLGG
jgi:hypothetical protein